METMSIVNWIVLYLIQCIFYKWIISWGGAQYLEGWKAWFSLGWFTLDWNSEQIRLYALILWIGATIWFLMGLFAPELRF